MDCLICIKKSIKAEYALLSFNEYHVFIACISSEKGTELQCLDIDSSLKLVLTRVSTIIGMHEYILFRSLKYHIA